MGWTWSTWTRSLIANTLRRREPYVDIRSVSLTETRRRHVYAQVAKRRVCCLLIKVSNESLYRRRRIEERDRARRLGLAHAHGEAHQLIFLLLLLLLTITAGTTTTSSIATATAATAATAATTATTGGTAAGPVSRFRFICPLDIIKWRRIGNRIIVERARPRGRPCLLPTALRPGRPAPARRRTCSPTPPSGCGTGPTTATATAAPSHWINRSRR